MLFFKRKALTRVEKVWDVDLEMFGLLEGMFFSGETLSIQGFS